MKTEIIQAANQTFPFVCVIRMKPKAFKDKIDIVLDFCQNNLGKGSCLYSSGVSDYMLPALDWVYKYYYNVKENCVCFEIMFKKLENALKVKLIHG